MKLSDIFTSAARTAVLETLAQFEGELHLRRIAELSEQNVHAIDVVLRSLKKDHLVKSRAKRQRIYFRLNMEKREVKLIKALVETKELAESFESKLDISRRIEKMLSFTDSLYNMKNKVEVRYTLNKILEIILSIFKKQDELPLLAEDLAINVYRKEIRNINKISLICQVDDKEKQKRIQTELDKAFSENYFKRNLLNNNIEITPKYSKIACVPIKIEFKNSLKNFHRTNFKSYEVYIPRIEDIIAESAYRCNYERDSEFLIDDVQNIFQSNPKYNLTYLLSLLTKKKAPLHSSIHPFISNLLKRASNEIQRSIKPIRTPRNV